jgi:hypothetical protein
MYVRDLLSAVSATPIVFKLFYMFLLVFPFFLEGESK